MELRATLRRARDPSLSGRTAPPARAAGTPPESRRLAGGLRPRAEGEGPVVVRRPRSSGALRAHRSELACAPPESLALRVVALRATLRRARDPSLCGRTAPTARWAGTPPESRRLTGGLRPRAEGEGFEPSRCCHLAVFKIILPFAGPAENLCAEHEIEVRSCPSTPPAAHVSRYIWHGSGTGRRRTSLGHTERRRMVTLHRARSTMKLSASDPAEAVPTRPLPAPSITATSQSVGL
jgi:hypothetical protein